jgi:hypothetical protein
MNRFVVYFILTRRISGGPSVRKSKDKTDKLNIGIEFPRRRFGVVAMEKGFISADQLWEALVRQTAQDSGLTERRHIGMILKDLGYLSFSQLNEVLQAMEPKTESKETVPELPVQNRARRRRMKSKGEEKRG